MLFGTEGRIPLIPSTLITINYREDSNNTLHEQYGEYNNVSLYIPIGQPNARTLAKLASLKASSIVGDRNYTLFSLTVYF